MQKHLSVCTWKTGYEFTFDNGKIIDYQEHYSNIGDVPFSVYYDFETTTGSAVFFYEKMFVVSYCMIIAFHQTINLLRIVIFRSFDQNENELYSLSHFNIIDFDFFNQNKRYFNFTTLRQLKTAASNVLQKESNTALAEMFNIELKFTVDAIKDWLSDNKKSHELDFDDKALFKKNTKAYINTQCCLCDFSLDPKIENSWLDHVIEAKHLFLENIYTEKQIKQMEIEKLEEYWKKIKQILNVMNDFVDSIENPDEIDIHEVDEIISNIKKKLNFRKRLSKKIIKSKNNLFLQTRYTVY